MIKFMVLAVMMMHHARDTPAPIAPSVPFDVEITEQPGRYCSPVDLSLRRGRDGREEWVVEHTDGEQYLFNSFADLFYQCDGQSCFMVTDTATGRRRHLCLK